MLACSGRFRLRSFLFAGEDCEGAGEGVALVGAIVERLFAIFEDEELTLDLKA